jgi:hypothetical protein
MQIKHVTFFGAHDPIASCFSNILGAGSVSAIKHKEENIPTQLGYCMQ